MSETEKTATCNRADDLISLLYGEASESEARDFERHLLQCADCRTEMASLGEVRESISLWKEDALSGFITPQFRPAIKRHSALAAVRQFFDLSPLWMKGAVAFGVVLFCVMIVLTVMRTGQPPASTSSAARFTQNELDQAIARALKEQENKLAAERSKPSDQPSVAVENTSSKPRPMRVNRSGQLADKVRRPLSKAEREQLAADLRLLINNDEDTLNLLGDRINQEF